MRSLHLLVIAASPLALICCQSPLTSSTSAAVSEAVVKNKTTPARAVKYSFTPNSTIGFVGSMTAMSHHGGFTSFDGHFHIADGQPVGNDHQVVIDMNSTWADNDGLTWHLKSPDFFDVEKYPRSTFDVTSVQHTGGKSWNISGNFTFHGVTRNITFPATIVADDRLVRINATFDINRKDFGITYASMPEDMIRDQVVIQLRLEARPAG